MNWAWWDGKMPVEQYRHEHELDKEAFAKPGAQDLASRADKPGEGDGASS
jgi:hypothetical protein